MLYRDTLLVVGALFLLVVHPSQSFIESVCDGIKVNDQVCERNEKGNKGNDILIKAKEDAVKNNIGLTETRVVLSRYHLGTENSRIYRERSSEDSSAARDSNRRQRLSTVSSRFNDRMTRFEQARRELTPTRQQNSRDRQDSSTEARTRSNRIGGNAENTFTGRIVTRSRNERRDSESQLRENQRRNTNSLISRQTTDSDYRNSERQAKSRFAILRDVRKEIRNEDRREDRHNSENRASVLTNRRFHEGNFQVDRSTNRRETREISQKNRRNVSPSNERNNIDKNDNELRINLSVRNNEMKERRISIDDRRTERRLSRRGEFGIRGTGNIELVRTKREASRDRSTVNRIAERRVARETEARISIERRERFSNERIDRRLSIDRAGSRNDRESRIIISGVTRNIPNMLETRERRLDISRLTNDRIIRNNDMRDRRTDRITNDRRENEDYERNNLFGRFSVRISRNRLVRETQDMKPIYNVERNTRREDRQIRNHQYQRETSLARRERTNERLSDTDTNRRVSNERNNEETQNIVPQRQANRVERFSIDHRATRDSNINLRSRSVGESRVDQLERRSTLERSISLNRQRTHRNQRSSITSRMERNGEHSRSVERVVRAGLTTERQNKDNRIEENSRQSARITRLSRDRRISNMIVPFQNAGRDSRFDLSNEEMRISGIRIKSSTRQPINDQRRTIISRRDNRNIRSQSVERASRLDLSNERQIDDRRISQKQAKDNTRRQSNVIETFKERSLSRSDNRNLLARSAESRLDLSNERRIGSRIDRNTRRQSNRIERTDTRRTSRIDNRNIRSYSIERVSRVDLSGERRNDERRVSANRVEDSRRQLSRFSNDRRTEDSRAVRFNGRRMSAGRQADPQTDIIREISERRMETLSNIRSQRLMISPEQYEKSIFKLNTLDDITKPVLAELGIQLLKALCICTIFLQIGSTYKDSKIKSGFFGTLQNWGQMLKIKVD